MVIVLGLLNNISYGPQLGGGGKFCTSRGGVVAVSRKIAVTEKAGAKLSQFCHINKV